MPRKAIRARGLRSLRISISMEQLLSYLRNVLVFVFLDEHA
jgi:hypothetical protein